MNIYDFDGTIYNGDSCRDIVIYGLLHYPSIVLKSLKKARLLNEKYKKGYISFEEVKEALLSFIYKINNYPKFINSFVDSHMKKIKPFYLSRKSEADIIVTASYDLWIKQFAKRLGIKHVIATNTDSNGKIIGKNCKGEEKVKRIKELYSDTEILCAYGDSSKDIPVLKLAKTAYVVEGNKLFTYKKDYKFKNNK